jgi:hypothetical protein
MLKALLHLDGERAVLHRHVAGCDTRQFQADLVTALSDYRIGLRCETFGHHFAKAKHVAVYLTDRRIKRIAETSRARRHLAPARLTKFSMLICQIFAVLQKGQTDDERVMVLQSDGVP